MIVFNFDLDFVATELQVNLCQKHLLFYQLTQNMTKDCSLNYKFNTCCVHQLFIVFVLSFRTTFFLVLNLKFNEQSVVIFWVNWCENECFWQRVTCTRIFQIKEIYYFSVIMIINYCGKSVFLKKSPIFCGRLYCSFNWHQTWGIFFIKETVIAAFFSTIFLIKNFYLVKKITKKYSCEK